MSKTSFLDKNIKRVFENFVRRQRHDIEVNNMVSSLRDLFTVDMNQKSNPIRDQQRSESEISDHNSTRSQDNAEKTLIDSESSIITNAANNAVGKRVPIEYCFPTPVILDDLIDRYLYYKVHKEKEYNWGVLGFEVDKFFSYGAYFCKYEAVNEKLGIVSVGLGNGAVENEITSIYPNHFGDESDAPKITLVDPDPESGTEFKTVDDLLEKCPNLVGNCVLFLIWPEPEFGSNNNYDIDAICKLKPRSVLTLYETTGLSGSTAFRALLDEKDDCDELNNYKDKNPELNNYSKEEIAQQEVTFGTNKDGWKFLSEEEKPLRPEVSLFKLRIVKMKKV